jgi:5-deoxy-glucuronate isomerase
MSEEDMPNLLVKPNGKHGHVTHVTPESAGWTYVGFDLFRLKPGEGAEAETGDREACLVFIAGKGRAEADGNDFGEIGARISPFEGKPWSVYVPAGSRWKAKPCGGFIRW